MSAVGERGDVAQSTQELAGIDLVVIAYQVAQSRCRAAGEHHALQLTRVPDGMHRSRAACRSRRIRVRVSRFYYLDMRVDD